MNTKKIITYTALAVIILLAVFWLVRIFTGNEESQGGVTLSSGLPGGVNLAAGNITSSDDPFITLLEGIKDIDLTNLKLLSYPIFMNGLRDLSRPVSDRGRGRENPFAQIGIGNLSLSDLDNLNSSTGGTFDNATTSGSAVLPEDGSDDAGDDSETTNDAVTE